MSAVLKLAATLQEQVASQLRHRILSGQLLPGTPRREQLLAAEFGISRGPIRDALLNLSKEGLLLARPNVGVRVANEPSEAFAPSAVVQHSFRTSSSHVCPAALMLQSIRHTAATGRQGWPSQNPHIRMPFTPGMSVEVVPEASMGGKRAAKVKSIDKLIDAASGTFAVFLEMPNPKLEVSAGVKCRAQFSNAIETPPSETPKRNSPAKPKS